MRNEAKEAPQGRILIVDDDLSSLRLLTEILTAGQRAAALTRQLLAFSRRQVLTFQIFDLNEALSSISSMIERLIGEDLSLIHISEPTRPY